MARSYRSLRSLPTSVGHYGFEPVACIPHSPYEKSHFTSPWKAQSHEDGGSPRLKVASYVIEFRQRLSGIGNGKELAARLTAPGFRLREIAEVAQGLEDGTFPRDVEGLHELVVLKTFMEDFPTD